MLISIFFNIFCLYAFVISREYENHHNTAVRSRIRSFDFTNGMHSDSILLEAKLRDSMNKMIKLIEDEEKMRQEKEMEEKRRKIINDHLLTRVYAPVLNDFYSRF